MEAFYGLYFHVLELPNIKVKKPSWLKPPSAMVVFSGVLLSYFLVTGGKLSYNRKWMFCFSLTSHHSDVQLRVLLRVYFDCRITDWLETLHYLCK